MNDRETKELTTPSGKPFTIKTYLTARERNELRNITINDLSIENLGETPKIANLNGELLDKFQYKAIELAVISFDGSPEKITERLLDGRSADYDFVVNEAVKVADFGPAK